MTIAVDTLCKHCGHTHAYAGFVYRWTNRLNGKWYIGSHYGCLEDGYVGSGVVFRRAIKAHGLKEFERDILFQSWCSRRELLEVEEQILIELDVRDDRSSYNTKNKGLGQDPEVTRRIFLGKTVPRESVERRVKANVEKGTFRGEKNGRANQVVCLSNALVFPYARKAAQITGGHEVGISESCTKGTKHRGQYWMFLSEWEAVGRPTEHPRATENPWRVVRMTDGKVYDSASQAASEHNVAPASIALACSDPHRSCSGHHWCPYDHWLAIGEKLKPLQPYDRSAGSVIDSLTGREYSSATACGKEVGLSDVAVMNQIKGKTRQRRFYFVEEWLRASGRPKTQVNIRARKFVRRIDTGEIFDSITAAAVSAGGGPSGLSIALQKNRPYRGILFEIVIDFGVLT